MKYDWQYVTITADISTNSSKNCLRELLDLLDESWEIYCATGTAGGVHYILRQPKFTNIDRQADIHQAPEGVPF